MGMLFLAIKRCYLLTMWTIVVCVIGTVGVVVGVVNLISLLIKRR